MFARPRYLTGESRRFLPWGIVGIVRSWSDMNIYKLYMFLKLFSPSVGFPNKSCCGYSVFAALGYPLPTLTYRVRPSGIPAPSIKKQTWQDLRKCITIPYTLQHGPPSGPSVASGVSMRYLYYKYSLPSIDKWGVYETNCTYHILVQYIHALNISKWTNHLQCPGTRNPHHQQTYRSQLNLYWVGSLDRLCFQDLRKSPFTCTGYWSGVTRWQVGTDHCFSWIKAKYSKINMFMQAELDYLLGI